MDRSPAQLTVGQLMTPDPIIVDQHALAEAAARMLEEHEVSGLPVVDAEGMVVGVISESDIVRARATPDVWSRWSRLTVAQLMHGPVITADPGTTIEEAAETMEQAHVHRLVVVGEDQRTPIGIISTSDLVRAVARRAAGA